MPLPPGYRYMTFRRDSSRAKLWNVIDNLYGKVIRLPVDHPIYARVREENQIADGLSLFVWRTPEPGEVAK
jgi:hypothetical protein